MKDRSLARSALVLVAFTAGAAFGIKSAEAQTLLFQDVDCTQRRIPSEKPFLQEAILPQKINDKKESTVVIPF
jgi:hypothetical protein